MRVMQMCCVARHAERADAAYALYRLPSDAVLEWVVEILAALKRDVAMFTQLIRRELVSRTTLTLALNKKHVRSCFVAEDIVQMVASFGQTGYLGFQDKTTVFSGFSSPQTAAKSRMGNAAMGNCIIMHLEPVAFAWNSSNVVTANTFLPVAGGHPTCIHRSMHSIPLTLLSATRLHKSDARHDHCWKCPYAPKTLFSGKPK